MDRLPTARRAALAVLGLALVATATACSGGGTLVGTNPAAVVNGTDITREQVAKRVSAYKEFLDVAKAASATGSADAATASLQSFVSTELPNYASGPYATPNVGSADQLTQLITEQIYEDALDAAGGKLTKEQISTSRQQFEQSITQQGLKIEDVPKAIVDSYVRLGAISTALGERLQDRAPKRLREDVAKAPARYEARLRSIYDQDPESFRQVCAFLIGANDEASANALRDRIDGGEDFAAVAKEASIIDPTAATTSNCYNAAQFLKVFGAGDEALKAGALLGPATPDTTWLIAKVDTTKASYEDVRASIADQVQDTYTTAAQEALSAWIVDRIDENADVKVDPRYGRWDAKKRTVVPNTTVPVVTQPTIATAPAGG